VTALAQLPGVLDLGQGWPDFGASEVACAAAAAAIEHSPDPGTVNNKNQYSGEAVKPMKPMCL
jgi:hypothetical protein